MKKIIFILFILVILFVFCKKEQFRIKEINNSECIRQCARSLFSEIDADNYFACKDLWKDKKCCVAIDSNNYYRRFLECENNLIDMLIKCG